MARSIIFEERVEIPMDVRTLADFRRWALSDDFPKTGRIAFVARSIGVDMSPEEIFCHGTLKVEIIRVLSQRLKRRGDGHLVTDSTRVSCPQTDLSVEPDIVFLSNETLARDRARLVAKSTGELGRYIEVEGPPDLIAEIVSDSSVAKDTRRLPAAYALAGVREYWLIDARVVPIVFQIHHLSERAYQPAIPDTNGFQQSIVFAAGFRLDGTRDTQGIWHFDLLEKE
ncbi:MAG: Uma2 family endonuclease [Pirellulales bacterium]